VDQQNDLGSVMEELLQAEQTCLNLESDNVPLKEKCKFLEMRNRKLDITCCHTTA